MDVKHIKNLTNISQNDMKGGVRLSKEEKEMVIEALKLLTGLKRKLEGLLAK